MSNKTRNGFRHWFWRTARSANTVAGVTGLLSLVTGTCLLLSILGLGRAILPPTPALVASFVVFLAAWMFARQGY